MDIVRPVSLTTMPEAESVIGDATARAVTGVLVFILFWFFAVGVYAMLAPPRRRGRITDLVSPPAHAGDEARAWLAGRRRQCLSF